MVGYIQKFDYQLIILYYVILLCNNVLMSFTAEACMRGNNVNTVNMVQWRTRHLCD